MIGKKQITDEDIKLRFISKRCGYGGFLQKEKGLRKRHFPIIALKSTHIVASSIFFVIIILATIATPCFADNNISWTEDELAFMQQHPVIKVGIDPEFVPFEFLDENGEYKGIAPDYLSLISEKTGMQFEYAKNIAWPEAYEMVAAGNLDLLPAITVTDEREEQFLFSEPYYHLSAVERRLCKTAF